ncbi:hypothetical protein FB451DRAFT_1406207 [Mycena latifolia]|nr:hypothetical protein FB451DRAFT_1406207 [Mycena latifolia]
MSTEISFLSHAQYGTDEVGGGNTSNLRRSGCSALMRIHSGAKAPPTSTARRVQAPAQAHAKGAKHVRRDIARPTRRGAHTPHAAHAGAPANTRGAVRGRLAVVVSAPAGAVIHAALMPEGDSTHTPATSLAGALAKTRSRHRKAAPCRIGRRLSKTARRFVALPQSRRADRCGASERGRAAADMGSVRARDARLALQARRVKPALHVNVALARVRGYTAPSPPTAPSRCPTSRFISCPTSLAHARIPSASVYLHLTI